MIDRYFVICVPESWQHSATSTLEECSECGSAVWLSRSGAKVAEDHDAELLCVFCAEYQENKVIMPPTPEQIEAVEQQVKDIAERN